MCPKTVVHLNNRTVLHGNTYTNFRIKFGIVKIYNKAILNICFIHFQTVICSNLPQINKIIIIIFLIIENYFWLMNFVNFIGKLKIN